MAGLVVLALVATASLGVWSTRRAYPDYDGTAEIPRLTGEVEVFRDENGIPHIYADTPEDLFRAQAYVHAQDRFWQMDVRRHITAGRLSELFGEDQVETDAFVRTLGWTDVAQAELPLISPESRRYFDAYADGVNAWLDGHDGGELGLAYTLLGLTGGDDSPDPWTPVDSLSWLKAMAWDLRGNMQDEATRALLAAELPVERVEQLYPPPAPSVPPVVADQDVSTQLPPALVGPDGGPLPLPDGATAALRSTMSALAAAPVTLGSGTGIGSNAWAVAGEHTESGAPLLANDPHLAPGQPSIWYQVGLHCRDVGPECPFDVVGYSFAGLPGVVIGHNQDVAWGFTNLGPDVSDLYLEEVRDDTYRVGDQWVPMETREETIEVAGADDVTITVRETRHGPILSDHDDRLDDVGEAATSSDAVAASADSDPDTVGEGPDDDDEPGPVDDGYEVALRWTALDPGRTADAIFALNQASDWESFRAAAALFDVPSQNLVYADVEGNIGYQAPGRIPVRTAADGRYPVPGWTGEYEWAGFIPFANLPSVLNPDGGLVVTANQPVTSDRYPFLLTADFDPGHRAARITELLTEAVESGEPLDTGVMADIQLDTHNAAADILLPHLLELDAPDGYYGDGLRLLADWGGAMESDSAAAAYFAAVWRNLMELTFHDDLPEDEWPDGGGRWFEVMRALLDEPDDPYWDDIRTESVVETRDLILVEAARDARDDMTVEQGKDASRWDWGRLHAMELTEQTFGTSGVGLVEWLYNRGPVEVGGGGSIVDATAWDAAEGYETVWAPSMRMIVDLGDLNASRWIDLTGISGHPFHEHYTDQTELWRDGETLPMRWDADDIRAAAEHTFTFVPPEPATTP
ncbi:penicillin acylase family protein [Jiangella asiatica]|uniref:Penicillin acylase family protein n=1 Tax=Jiangella asiatica TaxID=2530372 RepID=A0A4R5D6Z3_9ACTN|nr:penicillin acylase family protein [Jiangella asiatica]